MSMWESMLSTISPLTDGRDGLATVPALLLLDTLTPWAFKSPILWLINEEKRGVALVTLVILAAVWVFGIMLSKAM